MNTGANAYKYILHQTSSLYERYAPYSFKVVREKCKEMGLEYSTRQYLIQIIVFAVLAFVAVVLPVIRPSSIA